VELVGSRPGGSHRVSEAAAGDAYVGVTARLGRVAVGLAVASGDA
jgi:hypothetical protein